MHQLIFLPLINELQLGSDLVSIAYCRDLVLHQIKKRISLKDENSAVPQVYLDVGVQNWQKSLMGCDEDVFVFGCEFSGVGFEKEFLGAAIESLCHGLVEGGHHLIHSLATRIGSHPLHCFSELIKTLGAFAPK
jgi:hypothetical protein